MIVKHVLLSGIVLGAFFLTVSTPLHAKNNAVRTMRYYENLTAQLSDKVRAVQDENANLEVKITELQQQVKDLQAKNKEMAQEIQQLKRQSAAESEAREAQLREISNQIKKLAALPVSVPSHTAVSKDDQSKYEIYVVQKGATLSAIAKAYHVSVQSIKRANNMKDDNLRIGQKLKIPVR